MKKHMFGSVWIISLVLSCMLAACNNKSEVSAPPAQKAASSAVAASATTPATRNYVAVGVEPQSEPMVFFDTQTNVLTGYEIDLAKEVFKRAGLKYEFVPIEWDKKEDDLLKEKSIDAIWSALTITNARKNIFAFSLPYVKNRQVILVRLDSPIQSKADLKGKKVAVQKGSTSAEFVRAMSGEDAPAEVKDFDVRSEQFLAVMKGLVDATVMDSTLVDYYVANSPGKFRILKDSLQEEEFGIAVRPNDTELLAKINKALTEMEADGTSQVIYQRWFSAKQ